MALVSGAKPCQVTTSFPELATPKVSKAQLVLLVQLALLSQELQEPLAQLEAQVLLETQVL